MRILHVIPSIHPEAGGTVEGVKQLCSQYPALSIQAEIACCDAPGSEWLKDSRLPAVHALGPGKGKYAYTPALLAWLKTHRKQYDAVIVDGLWQYPGQAVHRALAGTETPYFVFTHGMLDPWFKRAYPLKHMKKWLYWLWSEYRTLRDASAVIFTCEEERLLSRESFWLYNVNEAVALYGTDSPPSDKKRLAVEFISKFPSLTGKRIMLFLSRIHEKKGCDLLIEAFSRVAAEDDRLHLMMAGPDQTGWQTELQAQAERLGIAERITWPGMLRGKDKWGAFYAADVFCLPSHQENFGIVVAEALACGTPVLISNKVNIWREIEKDGVGFVNPDSVEGTELGLRRWLSISDDERARMREQAKRSFATRFHIRKATERIAEIITSTNTNRRRMAERHATPR